jgi:hypothetical protein
MMQSNIELIYTKTNDGIREQPELIGLDETIVLVIVAIE